MIYTDGGASSASASSEFAVKNGEQDVIQQCKWVQLFMNSDHMVVSQIVVPPNNLRSSIHGYSSINHPTIGLTSRI